MGVRSSTLSVRGLSSSAVGQVLGLSVGIDLAVASGKLLPACFALRECHRLQLLPRRRAYPRGPGNEELVREPGSAKAFAETAAEFLQATSRELRLPIRRVAIDAPRAPRPAGCQIRPCEAMLRELRQSFFKTPSQVELDAIRTRANRHLDQGRRVSELPNANRIWMLAGFAFFSAFAARRWRCIEVYPYATMVHVFCGDRVPSKKTPDGRLRQLDRLVRLTGNSDAELGDLSAYVPGSAHDRIDAFGAAWVASLRPGEYQDVGPRHEDRIRVPCPRQ